MTFVFGIVGILAIITGAMTALTAKTAMHEIIAVQAVVGGFLLMAMAWLIDAVRIAADRIVAALQKGN